MGNDPSPLSRLREWWLALPLGRRVNVALYGLAGIAVMFLLGALLSGGDDTGQVAAGGTTTTEPPASTTSTRPTTTLQSTSTGPTTTTPTTLAGATSTTARSPGTTSRPNPTTPATNPPVETTTSTTRPACSNSGNPVCGEFRWEPAPAANQPLKVTLRATPTTIVMGQQIAFSARVEDPDHLVDGTCATIDFGDGSPAWHAPCPHPPACPPHFGPWTPPAAQPGVWDPAEIVRHTYATPGTFQVTAAFFSVTQDRCPDLDPYASSGGGTVSVTVTFPPTTTTTAPPPTSTTTTTAPST